MPDQLHNLRHSLAHLLAASVLEIMPEAKLGVGPTIEHGFYYDFLLARPLTPQDLPKLEKLMRKRIGQNLGFEREELTEVQAKEKFAKQPFKLELIHDLVTKGTTVFDELEQPIGKPSATITAYTTGTFVDLCRGGHVESTKEIPADAFKLTHIAGAYWRGSEKNAMLQRVYGVAFQTKAELDAHLKMQEEAKKRDHRKLGQDLDLFTFSDLVGSGLPLWTPKGTLLRDTLDSFVWELRQKAGYERVDIPHISKKDLFETSGHWAKFQDELFKITTREGHVFAMKPMNCPHHTQLYARKQFSYRELPQRYASTTKVYRDEQTGELSGLSRVRSITQDDAHVFCRESQVEVEAKKIWGIVSTFYRAAGFKLDVRLSFHDPKHPEKYLGKPESWKKAEDTLRKIVRAQKATAVEAFGEAAFYGPKIDFMAKDSLGREWQVATIQLDMNLPERFDLACINEKGERERIVMIHAAIMGSIERYLAILIEHFAGAFPLWLAPVQVAIIPVSTKHQKTCEKLGKELRESGVRVDVFSADQSVGKSIRIAEKQKSPYMLVIGDKEMKSPKLHVRERGKVKLRVVAKKTFIAELLKKIQTKAKR
ncbi:MAG: threonine--tRNA ligase [Patescibacteria group bacterium]